MPWISVRESTFLIMVIAVQTLSLYTSSVESAYRHHYIYWNRTNTLFRRRDSSIHIQLNDNVDVICPDYSDRKESPDKWEYYSIFFVSKEEYDSCTIINPRSRNVTQIRNCSTPGNKSQPFTLLILSFQPIPNLPDFSEGKKYYMISTSTGTQNGINNQVNGSCWTRNMRLILDMTVRPTTASPMPHTSYTTPTNRTLSTTSTPQPTTTTKSTSTTTTTKPPTTTTKKPTSKFPDGTPVDPSIVIEAPGGEKNTGVINAGVGQMQASFTVTFVLALVTFVLLL